MDHFRSNQVKLREAFEASLGTNPLAKLAQQNLAMFKAAASAFVPGLADGKPASAAPAPPASPAPREPGDELAAMRAQMAAMQAKLDKLSRD